MHERGQSSKQSLLRPAAHIMTRKTYLRVQVAALCLLVSLIPVGVMAITPAGTQIQATSTATYSATDGRTMPISTSNTVITTVGQASGVTVSPSTGAASADPGKAADFPLTVTNSGNVSDTFDLTAVSGSGWAVAIYKDANGDGVRQSTETTTVSNTGALNSGGAFKCFVTVTTPTSETTASDTVTFTAKSRLDSSKVATSKLTVKQEPSEPPSTSGPYIRTWLVNGSYANSDSATRLSKDYLGGESAAAPLEGSATSGKTWFKASAQTEILDLATLFGGATYCAGYVFAYVYSPTARTVNMWMGSDDGIKVWVNGEVVWNNDTGRACVLDQDKTQVSLIEGWNKLLVKISQGKGSWQVAVKLCDSAGNAVPGLAYDIKPAAASDRTPPVLGEVTITPQATSCRLAWTTDEPSSTLVEYGTTSALGQSKVDTTMTMNHSVTLTDLTENTTYYVRVGSADAVGNVSWDAVQTFKTTSSAPPPASNAYIQDWLVNGYYTASSSIRMSLDYIGGEASAAPKAGDVSGGKTWNKVKLTTTTLDLGAIFRNPSGCAAYAYTNVYSPVARSANLWLGSDDGIKVWVNGTVVWTRDVWRSLAPDQDKVPIQLQAGWNRLLIKVTQGGSDWAAMVKVCDSTGKQIPGVAYVP